MNTIEKDFDYKIDSSYIRGKFFKITSENMGLDYDGYCIKGKEILLGSLEYSSHNTKSLRVNKIYTSFKK